MMSRLSHHHVAGAARSLAPRTSVVALVAAAVLTLDVAPPPAGATGASYRVSPPATTALRATLTSLFLAREKHTHTLSANAQVHLDNGIYGTATHPAAGFRNPLVVDGPGHRSWAYAKFVPVVAHTTLRDQVAMQDGGNIAIFASSPTWHVVQIGVGWPTCVKAVLAKLVPAPVVALWLAHGC